MADVHEARPRLIKRYANRKLYDTRDSRYVTLQQIADYVRAGQEVTIIDNKSKEDLTNVTLAQIIYEEEKKGENGPRRGRSLRDMIQEGRDRIMTSLRDGPVGKLVTRERREEEPEPAEEKEPRRSMVTRPMEALEEVQRAVDERLKALLEGALGHVRELQAEVARLRGRIEELEKRLTKRGDAPQPPEE